MERGSGEEVPGGSWVQGGRAVPKVPPRPGPACGLGGGSGEHWASQPSVHPPIRFLSFLITIHLPPSSHPIPSRPLPSLKPAHSSLLQEALPVSAEASGVNM